MKQADTAFLLHAVPQSYSLFYPVDQTVKRGFSSRHSLLMEVEHHKSDQAISVDFHSHCSETLVLVVLQLVLHYHHCCRNRLSQYYLGHLLRICKQHIKPCNRIKSHDSNTKSHREVMFHIFAGNSPLNQI